MKTRVTFSTYDSINNPFYNGGGATAIHEVAKRLLPHFEVTIITSKYPGYRDAVLDGVRYIHIGWPYLGAKFGQLIFLACLPFQVLWRKFDIWFENYTPPIGTACLHLLTRKPVVSLIHMLPAADMERKYKLPFTVLEKALIRSQKYYIVLSKQTYKQIKAIHPKAEIAIIPNGIEIPGQRNYKSRNAHILYMGRLEIDQKGLDILLDAYHKLIPANPPPLVIAGNGRKQEVAWCNKRIAELTLEKHVTLTGRVEGKRKDRLFRDACCVVIPSRFETFSLTSLEAIAYKIPLVCFDIPGLRWIPKTLAFKSKPFDIGIFSQNMRTTSENKALRKSIIRKSATFIKDFDWKRIIGKYGDYIVQHTIYEPSSELDYSK